MSQQEKLERRLLSRPKDFTVQEAEKLLSWYGFYRTERGRTSGSRVKFLKANSPEALYLHRPHPGNELKPYQVEDLIAFLREGGYLK